MWQKERSLFKTVIGCDLYNQTTTGNLSKALNSISSDADHVPVVICGGKVKDAISIENHPNDSRVKYSKDNIVQALSGRMGTGGNNTPMVMEDDMDNQYVVRRLTPMECERLQGFPDNWTNIGEWVDSKGKKHKDADSPRYKALGNSIALPFWQYLADKMCNQLRSDGVEEPTMASLFSGICGFELVFARAGAKPIWNSEIEEFPEAVSRVHFGDDDTGVEGDYEQYL